MILDDIVEQELRKNQNLIEISTKLSQLDIHGGGGTFVPLARMILTRNTGTHATKRNMQTTFDDMYATIGDMNDL